MTLVICESNVNFSENAITCELCGLWTHIKCGLKLNEEDYLKSSDGKITYQFTCKVCQKYACRTQDVWLCPKVGHAGSPPLKKDHLKKVVMNGAQCFKQSGKNN